MILLVRRLAPRQLACRRTFFSWPGNKSQPETTPEQEPNYDFVERTRSQDPRGRIEFMRPYDVSPSAVGSILSQALAAMSTQGEGLDEEIHCVPFWTMMYTTAWSGEKLEKSTESRVGPLRIDFGCSVAAVGPDHWAHGTVLVDSVWDLYEERVRALYCKPPKTDEKGNVLLSDWFRGHRIPGENVAPFVKGYPVITSESITMPLARAVAKTYHAAETADNGGKASPTAPEDWVVNITEKIRTYAVPNYRIAYKSKSSKETFFRDGLYSMDAELGSPHYFALSKNVPRIPRGSPEEGSRAQYPFTAKTNRNEYSVETVDDDHEMITSIKLCDTPEDIESFARDIVKASNKAKLDWNDPNIFSSNLLAPSPNIVHVVRQAAYRSFKFPDPPAVHALDKVKVAVKPAAKATKGKVTLMPARAQKAQVVMQDPEHYYKLLEIEPDSSFLEASTDKAVTEKLDRSRRISRFLLRPHDADKELTEGSEQYGRVFDRAYEALNTVAKRKAYQRSAQQAVKTR